MKNLTQLIQEQKEKMFETLDRDFSDRRGLKNNWGLALDEDIQDEIQNVFNTAYAQSLTAIIRNEIDRKEGMIKSEEEMSVAYQYDYCGTKGSQMKGYNTAINEDIAYLENVLQELEKNI